MKKLSSILSASVLLLLTACSPSNENAVIESTAGESSESESTIISEVAKNVMTDGLKQLDLNQDTITKGLKETLNLVSTKAIQELATSSNLNIPLPDSLMSLQSPLQKMGKSAILDQLSSNLGNVSKQVIGDSNSIFKDVIGNINIGNPEKFIGNTEASITNLLKQQSFQALTQKLLPYVQEATAKAGTLDFVNNIKDSLPSNSSSLLGSIGQLAGIQFPQNLDINQYLTTASLNKVFDLMAQQEANLR